MSFYYLTAVLWAAVRAAGYRFAAKKEYEISRGGQKKCIALILLCAFLIRAFFAAGPISFETDINCFKSWGDAARIYGFKNFYRGRVSCDYPPGYIYILYVVSFVARILGFNFYSTGYTFLVKMPPVIADLGLVYFVYAFSKKYLDGEKGLVLAAAFALCPAMIYNSRVWGQVDSLYTLFVILSIYFILSSQVAKSAVSYAIALLIKPHALIFGPVLLFYMIDKKDIKSAAKAIAVGLCFMWLAALPFSQSISPLWLISHYKNTVEGYRYFTVNGYNLYAMLGLNWSPLSANPFRGGISAGVIILTFIIGLWGYIRQQKDEKIWPCALLFISVIFAFCTMMHERYLFASVILSLISFITTGAAGYFVLFLAFSCTNYINLAGVMSTSYYICEPISDFALVLTGLSACLCAVRVIYLWTSRGIKGEKEIKFISKENIYPLLTGVVTAVYRFFALSGLGSTRAPVTFWQSSAIGEELIIDFKEERYVSSMWSYSFMGDAYYPSGNSKNKTDCNFTVLYLDEKDQWKEVAVTEHNYVFTWKNKPLGFWTRYVKIRADDSKQVLGEMVFLDENGRVIQGDALISENLKNAPYNPLFALDESHTAPGEFNGYFHSAYFDEIYFARTAYEYIKGYPVYETTHPPLGKIIISLGIRFFGMNPFGWRVMGAVRGVAMLPVIYLLAVTLWKKKRTGFICALLLSLDFMHYTQTRIATVDSFLVLFLMLAFLFMARYGAVSPQDKTDGYLRLVLSGIFTGRRIAVKWNGAYRVPALAVYFFILLYKKSRKTAENQGRDTRVKEAFTTCCLCVVFFVLTPLMVYFASFGKLLSGSGRAGKIASFITLNKNMFSYHSQLVATHSYSSPWYTWWYMARPVWYSVLRMGERISTIAAMGNPLIWALIPFAVGYCLSAAAREKDRGRAMPAMVYISCLLPWAFISRLTFLYHYFPCAVFGILALGLLADNLTEGKRSKMLAVYIRLCAAVFALYFPVISGLPASVKLIKRLQIMPGWYFGV